MKPKNLAPGGRAIALRYQESMDFAPVIAAMGEKNFARLMKDVARRFGVPVISSKELIGRLSQLKVADEIPADLYEEVARVFATLHSTR